MAKSKVLTSYQRDLVCAPWYSADGKHALTSTFLKARRIGGSTAAAFVGALRCVGRELRPDGTFIQREPMPVWVVSKDFPSSKGLLREIAAVSEELAELDPDFAVEAHATTVKFKSSGMTATALPCSDKAVRSWTGFFIADEICFWRRVEDVWGGVKAASGPTLAEPRGYGMLIVSTPWDAGSLGHRLFSDESLGFNRHCVDIYTAKDCGFPIDIELVKAELGVPELFATEYECKFAKGGDSFFPAGKLRDACDDTLPAGWHSAPVVYGIDVGGGRGRDFTAVVQWRHIDDEKWMTGVVAFNDIGPEEQADRIAAWIRTAPGLAVVDRGIMGASLIDGLKSRLAGNRSVRVIGAGMNPKDQERYATTAKRLLESDSLRLYTGNECGGDENGHRALMLELAQLKTRPGVGGHLTFTTPRDSSKGHLDRAWASLIGLGSKGGVSAGSAGGYRPGVHTTDLDSTGIGMG